MGQTRFRFWKYLVFAGLAFFGSIGALLALGAAVSKPGSGNPLTGESFWTVMQGVSGLVAIGALTGSAVFALLQYSNSLHERHLSIYNGVFERLMSHDQVDARRSIYEALQFGVPLRAALAAAGGAKLDDAQKGQVIGAFVAKLDPEQHARIKLCLNAFDHLGFLVSQGWLDDDKTLGWLNPIVCKTWECLELIVWYERKRRPDPDYYIHCDELAARCAMLDKRGQRRKPASASAATDDARAWHPDAI